MITSSRNLKIRLVHGLLTKKTDRQKHQSFVVEGVRLTEELLAAHWQPELVLFSAGLSARGRKLVAEFQAKNIETDEVSETLLKSISDTETPQGILAVCPNKILKVPENVNFILILDGIRDPGNMGTILRSAVAAGTQAVITTPGTTDAFAPKVVRAAMGAHFRLPLLSMAWAEIEAFTASRLANRMNFFVAESQGGTPYWKLDLTVPTGIILGGEACGPGPEAFEFAKEKIYIPMSPGVESLNAGTAASILLFEVVRQRST